MKERTYDNSQVQLQLPGFVHNRQLCVEQKRNEVFPRSEEQITCTAEHNDGTMETKNCRTKEIEDSIESESIRRETKAAERCRR